MQKSIEVEYWVIDRDGKLDKPGQLIDHSELVEEEFVDCLFELKTPPCETVDELRTTFVEQLDDLLTRAGELDKLLVPLGTPINSESIETLDTERGRIQRRVVGSNFDYAKYCAGTHLHFEKRNVVDQLNVLIGLDPALALCNSSPFFQGEWTADGARSYLYRRKCYEDFPKHGQLWNYAETVAQWNRRLERRFDEFKSAAMEAGIHEEAVEANFSPDDVVWTPIRLRDEMPTVEWRSPDATLPSQVLQLVEAIDDLMEHLHNSNVRIGGEVGRITDDEVRLPTFDTLCDYAEEAMQEGLESPDVYEYLTSMGFAVDEYDPLTRTFDRGSTLSLGNARSIRRRYADRLAEDVDELARTC